MRQVTKIADQIRQLPGMRVTAMGHSWLIFSNSQYLTIDGEFTPAFLQVESLLPAGWEVIVHDAAVKRNSFRIQKTNKF